MTLLPHHKGVGWENLPRLLGNFTPVFLSNGPFGWQGFLLRGLSFLQSGLIEAGDFPHGRLVCHFLTTCGVLFQARAPCAPTGIAAARDLACVS